MERLTLRMIILAAIIGTIGVAVQFAPKSVGRTYTEDELEQMAPTRVLGTMYQIGPEDPEQSYKMDKSTYEALKPFGIVSRLFDIDGDQYDAVVIASRSKDSFHDPRVCFSAQGWNIEKFEPFMLKTEKRGEIPAMMIEIYSQDVRKKPAIFLYKGPGGFYGSTQALKLAFLKEQMLFGSNLDGVFYRFMGHFEDEEMPMDKQREKLTNFVSHYMDEAYEKSGGYF